MGLANNTILGSDYLQISARTHIKCKYKIRVEFQFLRGCFVIPEIWPVLENGNTKQENQRLQEN